MKKTIITLLITLIYSLIFCITAERASAYQVTEYKGVQVTYDQDGCEGNASACYWYGGERDGTINIIYWITEKEYFQLLSHEHAHHVYYKELSQESRDIWEVITNEDLVREKLESKGIDMRVKYVSIRAGANKEEDFAESLSRPYNGELNTYADVKQLIALYLINKRLGNILQH